MFLNLATLALQSERHNQYSPIPTLAALTLVSLAGLAALTFAPALILILALVLATIAGCVLTGIGAIVWALLTDGSRTIARERRETLERIAALEILTAELRAAIDLDAQIDRELGVLFGGDGTYADVCIEDHMVDESTWTSVLPGYRRTWAAQELAGYSNDDRATGDRVLTYCAGTDDDAPTTLSEPVRAALTNHFSEWKNTMVRVQAEVDAIMAERNAALSPVTSEPCPLSVMSDDGCPHHSCSWESGELVGWTPTMNYSDGTATRCERPVYSQAANSPVVQAAAEVAPLTPVTPITSEVGGWTNDELATHLRACGVKSARKNWTKGKLVAAYLALAK